MRLLFLLSSVALAQTRVRPEQLRQLEQVRIEQSGDVRSATLVSTSQIQDGMATRTIVLSIPPYTCSVVFQRTPDQFPPFAVQVVGCVG